MKKLQKWWQSFLSFISKRLVSPNKLASLSNPPSINRPDPELELIPPSAPDLVPLLAMDIPPPPAETPTKMNRHNRRVYERARRRHDKFVQPQGPQPLRQTQPSSEPKPKTKPIKITAPEERPNDPNDRLIVDEWLEGDGEDVLYEESEFWGEFNFRDTILDQLDRYWVYLERMQKHDPDAYGFYKQLGATLVPYAASQSWSDKPKMPEKIEDLVNFKRRIKLSPWFRQQWPAFGCCAYGTNPRDEKRELIKLPDGHTVCTPKFMYFRRVKNFPWTVQPVRNGKLYMLTIWWDRVEKLERSRVKWGRPQEFALQISDDGERIRVLKTRTRDDGEIGPWWDWQLPHEYKRWAKHYGLDVQTHLSNIFCNAVQDVEQAAYSMLRVEVSKGDLTAVFGLSPRRTGYFFQDRDIVLNEAGIKKRVFHMVRPHVRKDGTRVATHFRGLREFTWAGYRVWISIPGRDHILPTEFNVPLIHTTRNRKGVISEPEIGKRLKAALHNPTDLAKMADSMKEI